MQTVQLERDEEKTTLRRRQDNGQQLSHGGGEQLMTGGGPTIERRRRRRRPAKVRYTGLCGYYICYSIFVSVVGLTLLAVILGLHVVRCLVAAASSGTTDMSSLYECFADLRLAPPPPPAAAAAARRRRHQHTPTHHHT